MQTADEFDARQERDKYSSMDYWFPRIEKDPELLIPATTAIPLPQSMLDGYAWAGVLDGESPRGYDEFAKQVGEVIAEYGTPCFLRTNYLSGKHSWIETCYYSGERTVKRHLFGLFEASSMADLVPETIYVRAFLELVSGFTAHLREMPVNREFRFFVNNGVIEHYQFYWPLESILHPSIPDWKPWLVEASRLTPEELRMLSLLAIRANTHVPGFWSVDFAQDVDNAWWLIDMARGEDSARFEFKGSL